ncbi:hypothetical protein TIFTF001_022941 [Ficus carica]|uniref:Uncharacterized protein n=1 Tax=Ficus carica TaxID=3494 RepID=A0AA88AJI1_FICCA|nr:hypothetical protein TIFTF001_022941 [Ficus carica]
MSYVTTRKLNELLRYPAGSRRRQGWNDHLRAGVQSVAGRGYKRWLGVPSIAHRLVYGRAPHEIRSPSRPVICRALRLAGLRSCTHYSHRI